VEEAEQERRQELEQKRLREWEPEQPGFLRGDLLAVRVLGKLTAK